MAEVEPRLPSCGDKSCSNQFPLTTSACLTGTAGLRKGVKFDYTAGLIVDSGCRCVYFQVATDPCVEPSAKWVRQRSAYDVLLAAADPRPSSTEAQGRQCQGQAAERLSTPH